MIYWGDIVNQVFIFISAVIFIGNIKLSLYNIMNKNKNFPFQTQSLDLNVTSFESMINNLSGRIRKMELRLQFKTQQQKADFQIALKRYQDRESDQIQLSDEDQHTQDPIQVNQNIRSRDILIEEHSFVIPESFEMSILLRQRFMKRLTDIGFRLNVRFMVIPQKVKIIGKSDQRVSDAVDEYHEIRNNIRLQNFTEYSKQIYQSRFYKQKLKDKKVELIQISRNYYIWYQSNKTEPNELIAEVFHNTKHKTYPLTSFQFGKDQNMVAGKATVEHGPLDRVKAQEKITNTLITAVRAQIFQKFISVVLNQFEDRPERQVQLSEDRRSLLLHLDVEEQLQIQRKIIQEEYLHFKFIFLSFQKQTDQVRLQDLLRRAQEQPNFKKSKDKGSRKRNSIVWEMKDGLVCVAYYNEGQNLSVQLIQNHVLINFVRSLPEQMFNFKLALPSMLTQPQEQDWSSRFIFEKNYSDRLTYIGPKSRMAIRYEQMFKLYLSGKFTLKYLTKSKTQQTLEESSQATIDIIDMSRPVNETSLMISNILDETANPRQIAQSSESSILPYQIVEAVNFRFQNYTFIFREQVEDLAKKYSQDINQIQIMKRPSNPDNFQNAIKQATTYRYKYTKVRVPAKFKWNLQDSVVKLLSQHPEWKVFDRWVTVFAGGKQCKQVEGLFQQAGRVKVFKVEKNHSMIEGYLLLTNLVFLRAQGSSQLAFGQYEVTSFIKRVPN